MSPPGQTTPVYCTVICWPLRTSGPAGDQRLHHQGGGAVPRGNVIDGSPRVGAVTVGSPDAGRDRRVPVARVRTSRAERMSTTTTMVSVGPMPTDGCPSRRRRRPGGMATRTRDPTVVRSRP
jgi:hypothetical protein